MYEPQFGNPNPSGGHHHQATPGVGWGRYEKVKELGQGAFGVVYLARDTTDDNEPVAVKCVALMSLNEDERRRAMGEVAILRNLSHKNILRFLDVFIDEDQLLCLVTEFVDGGDLCSLMKSFRVQGHWVDAFVVADVARQLLEAITYLHSHGVIHRDLKPANVYITRSGTIKLGDFGVSKLLSGEGGSLKNGGGGGIAAVTNTFIGTPYYMCPELCLGEPYSYPCDVWSLGVMLFEFYCGTLPFSASNVLALINVITDGKYDHEVLRERPFGSTLAGGGTATVSHYGASGMDATAADDTPPAIGVSCSTLSQDQQEIMRMLVVNLVESLLVVDPIARPSASYLLELFFGTGDMDENTSYGDVGPDKTAACSQGDVMASFRLGSQQGASMFDVQGGGDAMGGGMVSPSQAFQKKKQDQQSGVMDLLTTLQNSKSSGALLTILAASKKNAAAHSGADVAMSLRHGAYSKSSQQNVIVPPKLDIYAAAAAAGVILSPNSMLAAGGGGASSVDVQQQQQGGHQGQQGLGFMVKAPAAVTAEAMSNGINTLSERNVLLGVDGMNAPTESDIDAMSAQHAAALPWVMNPECFANIDLRANEDDLYEFAGSDANVATSPVPPQSSRKSMKNGDDAPAIVIVNGLPQVQSARPTTAALLDVMGAPVQGHHQHNNNNGAPKPTGRLGGQAAPARDGDDKYNGTTGGLIRSLYMDPVELEKILREKAKQFHKRRLMREAKIRQADALRQAQELQQQQTFMQQGGDAGRSQQYIGAAIEDYTGEAADDAVCEAINADPEAREVHARLAMIAEARKTFGVNSTAASKVEGSRRAPQSAHSMPSPRPTATFQQLAQSERPLSSQGLRGYLNSYGGSAAPNSTASAALLGAGGVGLSDQLLVSVKALAEAIVAKELAEKQRALHPSPDDDGVGSPWTNSHRPGPGFASHNHTLRDGVQSLTIFSDTQAPTAAANNNSDDEDGEAAPLHIEIILVSYDMNIKVKGKFGWTYKKLCKGVTKAMRKSFQQLVQKNVASGVAQGQQADQAMVAALARSAEDMSCDGGEFSYLDKDGDVLKIVSNKDWKHAIEDFSSRFTRGQLLSLRWM